MNAWYASVLVGVADFDGRIWGKDKNDSAYRVVNAIFHNAACDGAFREAYKSLVAKALAAALILLRSSRTPSISGSTIRPTA